MGMQCAGCGLADGDSFRHVYTGEMKKAKICKYHLFSKGMFSDFCKDHLEEFGGLVVPLCSRCYACCPPRVIASYNVEFSHKVAERLTAKFPWLKFEIVPICDGSSFTMKVSGVKGLLCPSDGLACERNGRCGSYCEHCKVFHPSCPRFDSKKFDCNLSVG